MKLILLASILTLTGCATKPKPEVEMYLRFDKKTGVAEGYVDNEGQRTKIRMEPYEPLEADKAPNKQIDVTND